MILKEILKNTSILYVSTIINNILSFCLVLFLARYLGDESYGIYSFALVFVSMAGLLVSLGMDQIVIRDVSKNLSLSSKYVNNTISLRLILSIVSLAIIITTINFLKYPQETIIIVYLFAFYMIFNSMKGTFTLLFRAHQKMEFEAISSIFSSLFIVIFCILILINGYGLFGVAIVYVIGALLELILDAIIAAKIFVKLNLDLDINFCKQFLKDSFPLSLNNAFAMVYVRIDVILLSFLVGNAAVGYYSAAYNIIFLFDPIAAIFLAAIFPVMSKLSITSKEEMFTLFTKSYKYLFIIGFPISIGLIIISDKLISIVYGNNFLPAILALQILSFDILLRFIFKPASVLLVVVEKQNLLLFVTGSGAIINLILNLILIPYSGIVGAGIATLITETIIFILCVYFTKPYINVPYFSLLVKPLVASLLMGTILYYLNMDNLIVIVLVGLFIYFGMLFALRGFDQEDILRVKNFICRNS